MISASSADVFVARDDILRGKLFFISIFFINFAIGIIMTREP